MMDSLGFVVVSCRLRCGFAWFRSGFAGFMMVSLGFVVVLCWFHLVP